MLKQLGASRITSIFSFLFICTQCVSAQSEDSGLTTRRINLQVERTTLMYVLTTLAVDHRVPIGFEESLMDKHEPKLTLDMKDATLNDILNSVVNQEPIYTWDLRDGVINLRPIHGGDEFLTAFLTTRVNHFTPAIGVDKFQIRDAVLNLQEVRTLFRRRKVSIGRFNYPASPSVFTEDHVDLSISDTDVRGVLNRIIRNSEHKFWIVQRLEQTKAVRLGF
ncbi:MAG TPA: hypothetical protein VJU84_00040 [Pyrinomonadaceae bacterium]|nr:hypothetical protein [Pyrinomonadaceae bacterium]